MEHGKMKFISVAQNKKRKAKASASPMGKALFSKVHKKKTGFNLSDEEITGEK